MKANREECFSGREASLGSQLEESWDLVGGALGNTMEAAGELPPAGLDLPPRLRLEIRQASVSLSSPLSPSDYILAMLAVSTGS